MSTSTVLRCQSCEGELEATSKLYWTLDVAGQWQLIDASNEDVKLYCTNDCDDLGLTDDQERAISRSLGNRIIDLGLANVEDKERYVRRCGLYMPDTIPEDEVD